MKRHPGGLLRFSGKHSVDMIYLTYSETPSGVYFSQVTDVCKFLNKEFNANIRLVALISFRKFIENKKKINNELPDAIVLPMFPMVRFWKMNRWILCLLFLFQRPKGIIARGPLATLIALDVKKWGLVRGKVCFDSRAVLAAEIKECRVATPAFLRRSIYGIERKAIMEADFRMAVSQKLVDYWRTQFSYDGNRHMVIPCTLNTSFSAETFSEEDVKKGRGLLGVSEDDILLVYSGSSAEWQSFAEVRDFLKIFLVHNPRIKVVLLVEKYPREFSGLWSYRNRIIHSWVRPDEVRPILMGCDYGILLRKNIVTNEVASPVKFAEYLAAGLSILISEKIGDVSEFVERHHCGHVFCSGHFPVCSLSRISIEQKRHYWELAVKHFSKGAYKENYAKLITELEG